MAVRNTLVAFNDSASSEMALKAALIFQNKFQTHVTGLSTCTLSGLSAQVVGWLPDTVHSALREAESRLDQDVAQKWDRMVRENGQADKCHWLQLTGDANRNVVEQGRFFDLIFVGQFDTSTSDIGTILHPDRIALQSGRPILHIPIAFDPGPVNDHLIVAWDGKRAAARALSEALHLLGPANTVTILTVEDDASDISAGVGQLLTHLERHGIQATHQSVKVKRKSHRFIAQAIMEASSAQRPDALIMGAYEHSKFQEDAFGGVTETILREATFPIWMAH